jgi:hypothetical protein
MRDERPWTPDNTGNERSNPVPIPPPSGIDGVAPPIVTEVSRPPVTPAPASEPMASMDLMGAERRKSPLKTASRVVQRAVTRVKKAVKAATGGKKKAKKRPAKKAAKAKSKATRRPAKKAARSASRRPAKRAAKKK